MGESRETNIILIIIFLVLVGSLIGITLAVYSIIQTTSNLFEEQETYYVPTVFRDPEYQEAVRNLEYPGDFEYLFGVSIEDLYRLTDEEFSYDFITYQEAEIDRDIKIDTTNTDDYFYSALIKKHISLGNFENRDFYMIHIPKYRLFSKLSFEFDPTEVFSSNWWMAPIENNFNNAEKIVLCGRTNFEISDSRNCINMNKLDKGDDILIYSRLGEMVHYKVISISIDPRRTDSILKPSEDDLLRIVTSSDDEGDFTNFDYRISILSRKVINE